MFGFVGTLEAQRPTADAFELLADMTVLERWNPNVSQSRRIDGGRLEVGSRYVSTIVRGPFAMTAHSTLVHVDPPRAVRYEGTIAGFWSVDSLAFEPTESGTLITFRNESTPPRWVRPFSWLLNAAFQPQARLAVAGADRYLSQTS